MLINMSTYFSVYISQLCFVPNPRARRVSTAFLKSPHSAPSRIRRYPSAAMVFTPPIGSFLLGGMNIPPPFSTMKTTSLGRLVTH